MLEPFQLHISFFRCWAKKKSSLFNAVFSVDIFFFSFSFILFETKKRSNECRKKRISTFQSCNTLLHQVLSVLLFFCFLCVAVRWFFYTFLLFSLKTMFNAHVLWKKNWLFAAFRYSFYESPNVISQWVLLFFSVFACSTLLPLEISIFILLIFVTSNNCYSNRLNITFIFFV